MELVCISRKALYTVIEAKPCLYPLPPPPPQQFYSTNAYFRPLGLFFFVLSGNASLSYNFTNLVFVTSSLLFFIQQRLPFNTLEECYKNEGSGICIRYLPAGCISHFVIKLLFASVLNLEFTFRSSQATFPAHGLTTVSQSTRHPCILHHCW